MTVSELDRWRAAQQLITQHGLDAGLNAAQRADEALDRGDVKGFDFWLDISKKVHQLQAEKPQSGTLN